jgi:very-short-patch-repair endonuclease
MSANIGKEAAPKKQTTDSSQIKVIRFTNNQILHDRNLLVEKINTNIKELTTIS